MSGLMKSTLPGMGPIVENRSKSNTFKYLAKKLHSLAISNAAPFYFSFKLHSLMGLLTLTTQKVHNDLMRYNDLIKTIQKDTSIIIAANVKQKSDCFEKKYHYKLHFTR